MRWFVPMSRLLTLLAVVALTAGCTSATPAPGPSLTPPPQPTPTPSTTVTSGRRGESVGSAACPTTTSQWLPLEAAERVHGPVRSFLVCAPRRSDLQIRSVTVSPGQRGYRRLQRVLALPDEPAPSDGPTVCGLVLTMVDVYASTPDGDYRLWLPSDVCRSPLPVVVRTARWVVS